jgi:hypothetical protein
MNLRTLLQPCLLAATLLLAVATTACGGGTFNDPPGVASTAVAGTQNPLVAQITTTTSLGCSGQVSVQFGPDTTYGRSTAWYPATAASQTSTILVAGMRASTTYHMRVLGQGLCAAGTNNVSGSDLTFTTGPLPSLPFPTLAVTRPNPSSTSPENPGIEQINVTPLGSPAFFTDRDANPIWYYDVGAQNWPFPFKLLPNGHILLVISEPTASVLREVDLAGNTIRELNVTDLGTAMQAAGYDFVPTAFHHDFLALPNGHVVVITNFSKDFTDLPGYPGTLAVIGDGLVDLDANWNPVWAWNSFDYLDINRHLNGLPDWTHSNAIVYSPSDGPLLLSMRHQSWVLKINYNNGAGAGNILWHLGYQGDFALTNAGVPTTDPSLWFSFQHFPSIISQTGAQTNLAVWDNGDFRVLDTSGDLCSLNPTVGTFCYSRPTIFNVDEGAMVADLTWYNVLPYFSSWGGSINQLANGNVEFDLNSPIISPLPNEASQVEEVTQDANPQVVWQMAFHPATATAYRAYRVPSLYNGITWPY